MCGICQTTLCGRSWHVRWLKAARNMSSASGVLVRDIGTLFDCTAGLVSRHPALKLASYESENFASRLCPPAVHKKSKGFLVC